MPELRESRATVAAIAAVAYVMAAVAHEVVGHGAAFLLSGGRSCVLTTTRLIVESGKGGGSMSLWDLGGPCGNLAMAGIAWAGLRFVRGRDGRQSLLWWLALSYSLFWAFGYLLFCGVVGRGDWYALIDGRPAIWAWRAAFVVVGWMLYRWTMRMAGSGAAWSSKTIATAYIAGGVIACAGAIFDPRGPIEILNSGALSGFGAAAGLLWMPRGFHGTRETVARSDGWIAAALCVSILYIFLLGPGLTVRF